MPSASSISPNGSGASLDAPPVPKPRPTVKGVALAGAFWVLFAVLYALLIAQSEGIPFMWTLPGQAMAAAILALYSVPVWLLTVRGMDEWHGGWVVAAHLVLGPVYAWAGLETHIALLTAVAGAPVAGEVEARYGWIVASNGTIYAIQFAIYHLVRSTQRLRLQERQAAEYRARAREQEFAALKAQVNPHFLFNTLNSISAAVKTTPDQTREMIAQLADLLRYALDGTRRDLVPLRDELRFVTAYLDLEAHRFSDRLQVTVDVQVDDAALDTPVPPMVLHPLVENAVQHGIAPSEAGGTITLRIAPDGDRLRVTVTDTGVGPGAADPLDDPDGLGLANTDQRLRHAMGPDAGLRTETVSPHGFRVAFSVPRAGDAVPAR
ncbi:MAG: sensor histidine kinase [Bacteroidetes bacterium]|jgi:two-component sensor histidine kinase|nr:sensor histidine kinase [Bacteroidota bacterium]